MVRVKVVRVESDKGQNQNKKLAHVYMTSAALNYSPNAKFDQVDFYKLGGSHASHIRIFTPEAHVYFSTMDTPNL